MLLKKYIRIVSLPLLSVFLGYYGCVFIFHAENIDGLQSKKYKQIIGLKHEVLQSADTEDKLHPFQDLDKQVFYAPEERRNFFNQIGVEYCNDHIFEYEPILNEKAKESEKYLADREAYELLSAQYAADIAEKKLIPMSIRWIDSQVGHGIFAEKDTPKGTFIGVYGGQVKDRLLVDSKDYAWSYPGETLDGEKITLDGAIKGNELRLINDGKDPNCVVEYIVGSDDLWHVCYLALKDIKKGDQLLISYGPAYWESRDYVYQELAEA